MGHSRGSRYSSISTSSSEKSFGGAGIPFLKAVDAIALQQARIDLDRAYDNFFTGRSRFPLFKSRKGVTHAASTLKCLAQM
nr:hypothetical protein [Candidatus Sigynarchaeota archaeon]